MNEEKLNSVAKMLVTQVEEYVLEILEEHGKLEQRHNKTNGDKVIKASEDIQAQINNTLQKNQNKESDNLKAEFPGINTMKEYYKHEELLENLKNLNLSNEQLKSKIIYVEKINDDLQNQNNKLAILNEQMRLNIINLTSKIQYLNVLNLPDPDEPSDSQNTPNLFNKFKRIEHNYIELLNSNNLLKEYVSGLELKIKNLSQIEINYVASKLQNSELNNEIEKLQKELNAQKLTQEPTQELKQNNKSNLENASTITYENFNKRLLNDQLNIIKQQICAETTVLQQPLTCTLCGSEFTYMHPITNLEIEGILVQCPFSGKTLDMSDGVKDNILENFIKIIDKQLGLQPKKDKLKVQSECKDPLMVQFKFKPKEEKYIREFNYLGNKYTIDFSDLHNVLKDLKVL